MIASIDVYDTVLMTFIERLRHVYTLTKRIAKTQLPPELAWEP